MEIFIGILSVIGTIAVAISMNNIGKSLNKKY